MIRKIHLALAAFVLAAGMAPEARAWSTNAQRGITYTALQLAQRFAPSGFREYERDILRGAEAGHGVVSEVTAINSHQDAAEAVGREIQLLREARGFGIGSYYAYRMGVLSALVSDTMFPYGFAFTTETQALKQRIEQDIDARAGQFRYSDAVSKRQFIRNPRDYFRNSMNRFADARAIIADDYQRGRGFDGYLNAALQPYFVAAVDAVADAWYTVLRVEADVSDVPVSRSTLTWYFVHEIQYLLEEKRNFHQAQRSYANFERMNPGIMEAYERVGDLFYAFGSEAAIERGVREWRIAFDLGGPGRNRVAGKLANHYLSEGQHFLEKGTARGATDTDLPNALRAFQRSLEYNRASQEAAEFVRETNVAIARRQEQFNMNVNIIATADKVREEGDRAKTNANYGHAILTYQQAVTLFDTVDDQFPQLQRQADDSRRELRKNISDVIQLVLDQASDAIDAGERHMEENRFEEAIHAFGMVEGIVAVIPEDVSIALTNDKQQLVNTATRKVDEAKIRKTQYDEAMREQEAAQR